MATVTTDKPHDKAQKTVTESPGFGAYGAAATSLPDLTMAIDKMPDSKIRGSMDFTDSDKRWLKDLGITTTDPNSFHKVWESDKERVDSQHRTWANTYGGRVGMRAVSRGIVGAAFYAAGNMYSSKQMRGFNMHEDPENVLQHIARFIDNTAGKAIQWTVKTANHGHPDAEEKALKSVLFRDTVDYGNKFNGVSVNGRSLGHDAMSVTFDFASMSFGDYMTRYALGLVDPNAKKHWIKDGHIDVPGGVKDLLLNTFRGVTYAAGEDMAVAIPYVYGMKVQRKLIDRASPGFRYDSDQNLNGGSYKVKEDRIVGDYQLEGMVDLMGRFSGYNVGTKMFRDAYGQVRSAGEQFYDRWKAGDHSLPHLTPDPKLFTPTGAAHALENAVRYVARTTTKVMAYMLPATTTFFISRSPQSKVRGAAIHPKKGMLLKTENNEGFSALEDETFSGIRDKHVTAGTNFKGNAPVDKLYWLNDKGEIKAATRNPFDTPSKSREEAFKDTFYDKSPWYSKIFNPFGKLSYGFGSAVEKAANSILAFLGSRSSTLKKATEALNPKHVEKFSRLYANAAIAYTPYFMMKTDILAAEWDTQRTDMALDRTLDGIGHLNWGEFRAGAGEMLRAMMREPFTDPKREELAQMRRWHADPEHISNEAYQLNERIPHASGVGAKQELFASEALKAKKTIPLTLTQLKPRESWAAQEAVRQFKDTNTQGQSVH